MQKGVYPYEYMDDWKKLNEASLPEKEDFSVTSIWKILLIQITHTRVCKDFDIRKLCLKIYDLDPTYFLSTTGLVWQAAFKKTKNLLTDVVMC